MDEAENVVGGVAVFRDVTDTIRAELQRDCLISLIAHDIKNHLASEVMFFKLVENLLSDELDEGMQKLFDAIQSSNERFLQFTESLVELSRSRFFQGTDHAETINLKDALEYAIASNESIALQQGVKVSLTVSPDLPPAAGLPASIGQVFTNVILNAIEASEPNSTVNVYADRSGFGRPSIKIIDTGAGMSEEQVSALFDPKRVATHQMHSTHSTGFGLFLTFMLIQSQGGTMTCKSAPGRGTTVTIEFPSAEEVLAPVL
jgi:signal transduction histidine kinase